MVNYRSYLPGDEKKIVELWNKTLKADPITTKRFRNLILLDVNFDPKGLKLAFQDNELVGALYGVRRLSPVSGIDLEKEDGWITFFFVHPEERNKGIGTRLLSDIEVFFKDNHHENIYFSSYSPNYIIPGIDKKNYLSGYNFLKENNFETLYTPIAMDIDLVDFRLSKEIKKLVEERKSEGYTFNRVTDSDLYELILFANETFNPDWGRAIRESVLGGLSLENIIISKNSNNKIVGFCMFGGYGGIAERFGPFGVQPKEQGKKLGKILLNLCLDTMRAHGLHGAWFLWTGAQTTAGHLYKKTGFKTTREFHVMKKKLLN